MSRGAGEIQRKILLLLLGGVALGVSRTPKRQLKILKSIAGEWRKINHSKLKRAIKSLYRSKLIEERKEKNGNLTLVLTENGKEKALSYNIEEMKIAVPKHWDEKWRIVIFDIPETLKGKREILRFRLKGLGFYELQKSVFVHPFNCYNEIEYIVEFYQIRKFVRFIVADFIDNELHLKEHFGLK